MNRLIKVGRLILPLVVMILMAILLLTERQGFSVKAREVSLKLLPVLELDAQQAKAAGTPMLIVVNESSAQEAPYVQTLTETLDIMRIPWQKADPNKQALPELESVETILVCTQSMMPLMEEIGDLVAWIETGGHMALCMSQSLDDAFRVLYRVLGITEYDTEFVPYHAYHYLGDLFPLMEDYHYAGDGGVNDYCMPVHLENDCLVFLETEGDPAIPLLWERPYGLGRVAMFNATLISGKSSRGLVWAVLHALEDMLVYPIINAGMVFIDDFPAPQPEGFNEHLLEDFGYDIQGFYRHHWWPDMKLLSWDPGVLYSGVLIESYNDRVEPPFEESVEETLLRFYASELLHAGGEVGLHGYNHMPLNLEGFAYPEDVEYNLWPSEENMALSLRELYAYGHRLFPEAKFQTYVPPSNFLSPAGQAVLRQTLPDVRVISGLYLDEEGVDALIQEFGEEADGSISVPRLSSGFIRSEFGWGVIASELALHGVFSHFIHPDDVLDEERGATAGWSEMYAEFSDMMRSIAETYPELRFATAAEGAAAVQRYDRLGITRTQTEDTLYIELTGLYDDAWLALLTQKKPKSIQGGELHPVTDRLYWIEVKDALITVEWEGAP